MSTQSIIEDQPTNEIFKGPAVMPAIDQYGNRSWSKQHPMEDLRRYGRMRDCTLELIKQGWNKQIAWIFIFNQEFNKEPTSNQAKPIWLN